MHLYISRCHLAHYFLQGFSVEGKIGDDSDADSYINKCVYVEGEDSELEGFVMEGLLLQNCGRVSIVEIHLRQINSHVVRYVLNIIRAVICCATTSKPRSQ